MELALLLLFLFLFLLPQAYPCPSGCVCKGLDGVTRVYCNEIYYFPSQMAVTLRKLDLSRNNYTALPGDGFLNYQHLEELNVAYNNISHIDIHAFRGLGKLRILNLRGNSLRNFPSQQLSILTSLQELHIGWNGVHLLSLEDFLSTPQLRSLSLDGNALQTVPSSALWPLRQLEVLTLSDNNISHVANHSFSNFSQLQALSLANNHIRSVDDEAFLNLVSLEILELQHNELSIIPSAIRRLPALKKLSIAFNHIQRVEDATFARNPSLVHPDLLGNPVLNVAHHVFANLTDLKILILPEVKELTTLPDLNGTSSLEFLRVDRSQLSRIPNDLCLVSNSLKTMDFKSNYLTEVPNLLPCTELRLL